MKRRADRLQGLKILFEDDSLLVIDKPAGMLTTHTKVWGRAARESQLTADNILTDYLRKGQWKSSKRAWLVHRLDRDTSGVMMFAKSEALARKLREHWNETTEKVYLARVEGELSEPKGIYESWLREDDDGYRVRSVSSAGRRAAVPNAKFARTEWETLGPVKGAKTPQTRVRVKLHTGRKNQIRVHFSEHGHPVVGDEKYRAKPAERMFLHALRLKFVHPVTGKTLEFESPIPCTR